MKKITHQQIVNETSNGVIVTDKTGIITHFNKRAAYILETEIKNVLGKRIMDVFAISGRHIMKCLKMQKSETGIAVTGNKVDLVLNITLVKEKDILLGAICNFQEIKFFENIGKKLEFYQKLNKQLNTIFHSSSDGIWVLDSKGLVIDINKAAEKADGIVAKQVIGKNVTQLLEAGIVDRVVTPDVIKCKKQVTVISRNQKSKKTLLVTGTPALDEKGNISLIIVNQRDMSQLDSLREELEHSQMITEKIKDELTEITYQKLKKELIVSSKAMKKILQASLKLAHIDASNILILGESGVGKGMLAKFIHKNSRRNKKPFIQINCAALPENLLEAELFGYEKGAFTGAKEQGKIGLFELAHEGTLFLDEIGDMPLILQAKILKYLDDQEIMPIGGVKVKKIDCLVIAATNQNLERSARNQSFRRDLFYRLNTFTLKIPPLRERPEDIFELTHYFLNQYNKKYHKKKQIQSAGINLLQDYAFPGNIRELENIIKKAVAIGENNILDDFFEENLVISNTKLDKLLLNRSHFDIAGKTLNLSEELQNFEKEIFKNLVSNCRSTQELANTLGISQPTAFRKMKKHNLSFIG